MRQLLLSAGFIGLTTVLYSQSIIQPNYGLKSHETLEINKIESSSNSTVFYMTVENRIYNGNFCADKNIFIVYPDGTRSRLISSAGIPVCPEKYYFRSAGEKLFFTLTFPALKSEVEWIDLVEECSENCFSFYGITLDNEINNRFNEAVALSDGGNQVKALIRFMDLLQIIDKKNCGIEGLVYMNIILLSKESGNSAAAAEWYRKMKESGAPRLQLYINHLNSRGIKY